MERTAIVDQRHLVIAHEPATCQKHSRGSTRPIAYIFMTYMRAAVSRRSP